MHRSTQCRRALFLVHLFTEKIRVRKGFLEETFKTRESVSELLGRVSGTT